MAHTGSGPTIVAMRRSLAAAVAPLILAMSVSGCGAEAAARTSTFVRATGSAVAIAPATKGGLRFADGSSGDVYDVDSSGQRSARPLAHLDIEGGSARGVLGLAVDAHDRTFASWVDRQHHLVVSQVAPGPVRTVWTGPDVAGAPRPSGRMTFTPQGRLLVTTGSDGAPRSKEQAHGQLVTLDPDRGTDQLPNILSTGWVAPGGVAFAAGDVLWMVDAPGGSSHDELFRPGNGSPNGRAIDVGAAGSITALTAYGEQEVVACDGATGDLRRFLIQDGTTAVAGRTLAKDCKGGLAQLHDGRIAYSNGSEIRVTAL